MVRNAVVVEESEDIVLAQDESVLQCLEFLSVLAEVLVEQFVKPFLVGFPHLRSRRPVRACV